MKILPVTSVLLACSVLLMCSQLQPAESPWSPPLTPAVHRLRISRQGLEPVGETLALLGRLTRLTRLDLAGTFCEEEDAFGAALSGLQPLTALASLDLSSTGLCSRGLANLSTLQVDNACSWHLDCMRPAHARNEQHAGPSRHSD